MFQTFPFFFERFLQMSRKRLADFLILSGTLTNILYNSIKRCKPSKTIIPTGHLNLSTTFHRETTINQDYVKEKIIDNASKGNIHSSETKRRLLNTKENLGHDFDSMKRNNYVSHSSIQENLIKDGGNFGKVEKPNDENSILASDTILSDSSPAKKQLISSKVPSSRVGRLFQYGALVAGVSVGIATESIKRLSGISESEGKSLLLTKSNVNRIVKRLTRMRGAALKLGQMLSIQDNSMLPPELEKVLLQVQNNANYMPDSQFQKMMKQELGEGWRSKFTDFEIVPFAAASIGQVHKASLVDGTPVAVKVQYPGVKESIDSDLSNLKNLILFGNFLPKGLYLDNTIRVAQKELAWECDYEREASYMKKFSKLIGDSEDSFFKIPFVIDKLSTSKVLTSELVPGIPIGETVHLPQSTRDEIGTNILQLCLKELFQFNMMQTDPNWSNFLYDSDQNKVYLLDFGAAREFDDTFLSSYIQVIKAATEKDIESCIYWSIKLGFLTGMETETMTMAHVKSLMYLAEPFAHHGLFDFGVQDITNRVRSEIPTMLRERLTPPPDQTYSLHRKLSGCFLLCAKLKARVPCFDLFKESYDTYHNRK